jgi:hypothetical protein
MDRDTLLLSYLKEHYDAARHHQTLRSQTTTFIVSAAGVLFAQAVSFQFRNPATLVFGAVLIFLGLFNLLSSAIFHRSNRTHGEVASWTRRILANDGGKERTADPDVIRKAVARHRKKGLGSPEFDRAVFTDLQKIYSSLTAKTISEGPKRWKIEEVLNQIWTVIPFLIIATGILLIVSGLKVR